MHLFLTSRPFWPGRGKKVHRVHPTCGGSEAIPENGMALTNSGDLFTEGVERAIVRHEVVLSRGDYAGGSYAYRASEYGPEPPAF